MNWLFVEGRYLAEMVFGEAGCERGISGASRRLGQRYSSALSALFYNRQLQLHYIKLLFYNGVKKQSRSDAIYCTFMAC